MEKQKRWQLYLIIAVIFLTIYNILPTLFYYSKPLEKAISVSEANHIGNEALERVNRLENESLSFVKSFCTLLNVKTTSIDLDEKNPQLINVVFKSKEEADLFKNHLPRAGSLIPFAPAQLSLAQMDDLHDGKGVSLLRTIPVHFEKTQANSYFTFAQEKQQDGSLSEVYKQLLDDRLLQIGLSSAGTSENAQLISAALNSNAETQSEFLSAIAENINDYVAVFGETSPVTKRLFSSLFQGDFKDKTQSLNQLIQIMDSYKDGVKLQRIEIQDKQKKAKEKQDYLEVAESEKIEFLQKKEDLLAKATSFLKKQTSTGYNSNWSYQEILVKIQHGISKNSYGLNLENQNPLISSFDVDLNNQKILVKLHSDVMFLKDLLENDKEKKQKRDQLQQLVYNEIARISNEAREEIKPAKGEFEILLNDLEGATSFLALDLSKIAEKESSQIQNFIIENWNPKHIDLQKQNFPIWDLATYQTLSPSEKKLGLLVYAPSLENKAQEAGLKRSSIYVIAKGITQILKKYEENPKSEQSQLFLSDFSELRDLLRNFGYFGYPGNTFPLGASFSKDYIFENSEYYSSILSASRENFKVRGTQKFAVLDFTNVKQRIHAINSIDDKIHEDLLKWRDDYHAAQVNPNLNAKFDVPKPTANPLVQNFLLSTKKYFRGDERKILNWGLDLSGGKTVQIELRDQNNKKVTNPDDIAQGINELYSRVNKMGVSEVSIRQEGSNITLDFPGAQGLSATELVKASSMYFNIVNEKFSLNNPELSDAVNKFLQEVWNEAVVTNKKDPENINRIAWKHLYGESINPQVAQPRSDAAKALFNQGLRLPLPEENAVYNVFSNTLSKIAVIRGNNYTDWFGQSHPLMFVFNNYALEGSNLTNIHSSYDPTKGNFLSFEVKASSLSRDGTKSNPRADLYAWTSAFSKEKVVGSDAEKYSRGKGWRMAVILNGTVISAPTLDSAIKDSAMITGSFTQREVNKLEADLKAGSLTFSPVILSEKNVSPELGIKERFQGILATVVALALVISAIIGYYRFAGVVASVALLFNILIMWATLQNIQATMTLAGIAGIILAIGMSVDANVLVFERVKEEFKLTGRIASALNAGYKKAFSAIIDSNLTTIIAGLILLHFDSGPIKGFALTIIIGTISSMFTALFMTKFFFARWVQNPENKKLTMSSLIQSTNFNFLKYGKLAIVSSVVLVLLGASAATWKKSSIFGMDFTGGFSLTLELNKLPTDNYRDLVEKALSSKGLSSHDFQVRELSPSNHVRIFLTKRLEESGKPFYHLPIATDYDTDYGYQNNPRIIWIVSALNEKGLTLTDSCKMQLDKDWTSISGQISSTMRNNALYGLAIALVCILLYITIRFEFKYAVAATLGLAHDVLITIGAICILHAIGFPIQIELNTIAALMAIIGYSLNDTIIVFDRIREDVKTSGRSSFKEICNLALNVTLSRTLMTSGTTVLVLLALVCLGGSTIFGFAFVMTIGILFGTLSSLFIAAPLLNYLHEKETAHKDRVIEIQ